MVGVVQAMPDARHEIRSFGEDEDRNNVFVYAQLRGTHTGDAGPVPPTNRTTLSDFAYVLEFHNGRIRHITKIWNDVYSMRELGWM